MRERAKKNTMANALEQIRAKANTMAHCAKTDTIAGCARAIAIEKSAKGNLQRGICEGRRVLKIIDGKKSNVGLDYIKTNF